MSRPERQGHGRVITHSVGVVNRTASMSKPARSCPRLSAIGRNHAEIVELEDETRREESGASTGPKRDYIYWFIDPHGANRDALAGAALHFG